MHDTHPTHMQRVPAIKTESSLFWSRSGRIRLARPPWLDLEAQFQPAEKLLPQHGYKEWKAGLRTLSPSAASTSSGQVLQIIQIIYTKTLRN